MATFSLGAGGQPDNYNLGSKPGATDYVSGSNSSGSTSSSGSSNTSASGTSTQTAVTNSTTRNLDPQTMALLQNIIQQLASGGTPEMKAQQAKRNSEISADQAQRDSYSKSAAFSDSQGLIAQQTRRVLEQLLPSINRAAEDAGSSGGALRALLLQDAGNKAAESASALGVQAAAQYGGVSANLSSILEALTRPDATTTNALAAVANALKGGVSTTNGTTTTTGSTQQQSGTTQQQNGTTQNTEQKGVDFAPFSTPSFVSNIVANGGSKTAPSYYGPSSGGDGVNLTSDILNQIATQRAFGEFTF